jgi:ankyrin repeat protein
MSESLTPVIEEQDNEEVNGEVVHDAAQCVPKEGELSPDQIIAKLNREKEELLQALEMFQIENEEQKAQISRLQKDRIRKSVVGKITPLPQLEEKEESGDEKVVDYQKTKLQKFFQLFQANTGDRSQLSLHGVNSLVSLYHTLYADNDSASPDTTLSVRAASEAACRAKAVKIAFNYVIESIRQLNGALLSSKGAGGSTTLEERATVELSYPINWLLSLFPYERDPATTANKHKEEGDKEDADTLWMPLHFALALDSTSNLFDSAQYVSHISLLLEEFGPAAFAEDVSPLSVAVGIPRPNIEAIRAIVDYRPDSVSQPDEDGSLPFMHACASNDTLDVIEFLYSLYPEAAQVKDSFGCQAIHYAAFSGNADTVRFLLQADPTCATVVEGNGALPLHDAVQNRRAVLQGPGMAELLLQAYPKAARVRDDYGALPLHKAAKSAPLNVLQVVHKAFPKAMFAPDLEDLLPMHYYAERHDKDLHLDVLQYILQANPTSKALDDATLFAADPDPSSSSSTSGSGSGWMSRFFGGGGGAGGAAAAAKQQTPAATSPATAASAAPPGPPVSSPASSSSGGGLSRTSSNRLTGNVRRAPPSPPPPPSAASTASPVAGHNRRKSVRPVRASIHEQYKR